MMSIKVPESVTGLLRYAIESAQTMMLDDEFEPIIMQAFKSAKSNGAALAALGVQVVESLMSSGEFDELTDEDLLAGDDDFGLTVAVIATLAQLANDIGITITDDDVEQAGVQVAQMIEETAESQEEETPEERAGLMEGYA